MTVTDFLFLIYLTNFNTSKRSHSWSLNQLLLPTGLLFSKNKISGIITPLNRKMNHKNLSERSVHAPVTVDSANNLSSGGIRELK